MVHLPIFMDNNSTTRVDPRVLEAMLPYFSDRYGNAASRHHSFGWEAKDAVDRAREQVAELIGAEPREIIFTSGATESNNLALRGVAGMYRTQGNHIITTVIEHKAVLDPCKRLQREGFDVTFLPVDRFGRVTPEQVTQAITPKTILVSVMAANNEIGALQPIEEIAAICKDRNVLFHSDIAQAAGKIIVDVLSPERRRMTDVLRRPDNPSSEIHPRGIDLASLSAHKMYGPKGVGALYVRRRDPHVRLEPIFDGGGHEGGLRSGTLPVPLIVGFGKACELCRQEMRTESIRLETLREKLHRGITARLSEVYLNGHPTERLPGTLNLSFAHVKGDALMMGLRNVAISSGSACTSASVEPSYVLKALGVDDELAHSSIRFGLGRFNTEEEVDYVIDEVVKTVERLRAINPMYEMARTGKESR
jgi:cysteine desulfurase